MTIAIGVFGWLAVESRQDAGASQAPPSGRIPVERFQLLAQFEPPPYSPGAKRGTSHTRQFQGGMEHYLRGDFAGAIPGFTASVQARADGPDAQYYLGISSLLAGDAKTGLEDLQSVIDAGDTPYLEQARYYLAKALLGKGDIPGARRQLENVIAMHGDLEKQSKSLLKQIVVSAGNVN
jgi:TolA-binding protein